MENKIDKYFDTREDETWHDYLIGEYHVSSVGLDHSNLEPEEHYGPCIRHTYFQYKVPVEKNGRVDGALLMGKIIHREIQTYRKKTNPNMVVEFPMTVYTKDGLTVKGSIDMIEFDPIVIVDIKTASDYTFPTSEYDINPTYSSQVKLYTGYLYNVIFNADYFFPEIMRITTVRKRNLETIEQDLPITEDEWDERFDEIIPPFEDRVSKLHYCLMHDKIPDAEPHKWCKYCPNLEFCMERGDIVEVKEGRSKRLIKNEKA